jgi:hypothetical protein
VPAPQADPATVDEALRIVGFLPDITHFTEALKAQGKPLGVRVTPLKGDRYDVKIFEKGDTEKEYDVVTVDLKKKRILKRKRRV